MTCQALFHLQLLCCPKALQTLQIHGDLRLHSVSQCLDLRKVLASSQRRPTGESDYMATRLFRAPKDHTGSPLVRKRRTSELQRDTSREKSGMIQRRQTVPCNRIIFSGTGRQWNVAPGQAFLGEAELLALRASFSSASVTRNLKPSARVRPTPARLELPTELLKGTSSSNRHAF